MSKNQTGSLEGKCWHPASTTGRFLAATILIILSAGMGFGPSARAADAASGSAAAPSHFFDGNLLTILLTVVLIVMGLLLLWKALPIVIDYLSPQLQVLGLLPRPTSNAWPKKMADEEEVSKFVSVLNAVPGIDTRPAATEVGTVLRAMRPVEPAQPKETEPLKEFYAWVPGQLSDLHRLFAKLERTSRESGTKPVVRESLGDLALEVRRLQGRANLPELLPVLQMASALDGLLRQLMDRLDALNQSTLRTIRGGIDVLGKLSAPELRVDIATNPPIQTLTVDDDPVSRFALSSSIKKVFAAPAQAESGASALGMVAKQGYDIIFMDVSMPGMDGFEACSKIHETELNRNTPVVFVTGMKDFASQASALVSGGNDLIGKPFLTFEIAVKALSLVMQARLQKRAVVVAEANAHPVENTPVPSQPAAETVVQAAKAKVPETFSNELLAGVSANLGQMRNELKEIGQTLEETGRQEKLLTLYLRSQSLTRQTNVPELRPANQLATALQGLLKKLQEKPANAGASTLETATAAVGVLQSLCQGGVSPELADKPAISILVVDDEPLARRAVVGALQTAFLKPDSAEDGAAAMKLAGEKIFDVIFLDVQMPGMDGFQVCSKIRETELNSGTPVVFVTSQIDFRSRAQSMRSGADDYMVKPFLFVEITVKALTFALRNRLQQNG